jgi:hypothetical protein
LRGLLFRHPVPVHYLPAAAFERALTADAGDPTDRRARAIRTGALLRAMGLLGPNIDLGRDTTAMQTADTLAFYDNKSKQIYVRGTGPLTVDQRVTLAHELTHALQDQLFGLQKLRNRAEKSNAGSVDALTALVEGDATRVQALYLAGLSPADRRDYAVRSLAASRAAARTNGIPAVVATYFEAPYIFGTPVTGVLAAEGGNNSVDAALDGPPPSTRIYLDPAAVTSTPPIPAIPELFAGETKLPKLADGEDHFDNFTFYLMLAAKLDLPTALRAADAFGTGSQIAYTRGRLTCFRAAIDGVTRSSSDYLAQVLGRWAATMPGARVSFTAAGVLLQSCDPGADAVTPSDARILQAVRLAAGRDDLVAALTRQPLPTGLAVCAARVLVQRPDFRAAILDGAGYSRPTPQMVQESADAGRTCRASPSAGVA